MNIGLQQLSKFNAVELLKNDDIVKMFISRLPKELQAPAWSIIPMLKACQSIQEAAIILNSKAIQEKLLTQDEADAFMRAVQNAQDNPMSFIMDIPKNIIKANELLNNTGQRYRQKPPSFSF